MSQCAVCGEHFVCGMVAQDNTRPAGHDQAATPPVPCWCMSFPPVIAVPSADASASCLCPRCLQARVQQQSGLTPATSG